MPFGNRKKNILEDLFQFSIVTVGKFHPSGNLKFNNLGIFQSLNLRILAEKILPISRKLNFTPNTVGCYGLKYGGGYLWADVHMETRCGMMKWLFCSGQRERSPYYQKLCSQGTTLGLLAEVSPPKCNDGPLPGGTAFQITATL